MSLNPDSKSGKRDGTAGERQEELLGIIDGGGELEAVQHQESLERSVGGKGLRSNVEPSRDGSELLFLLRREVDREAHRPQLMNSASKVRRYCATLEAVSSAASVTPCA